MKLRLCTMPGVPAFDDCGIKLTSQWSELETDKLKPEGRDVLRAHRYSIIQIHPDDDDVYAKFAAEYDAAKKAAADKKLAAAAKK